MVEVLRKFPDIDDVMLETTWNVIKRRHVTGFGDLTKNLAAGKLAVDWMLSSPRSKLRSVGLDMCVDCLAGETKVIDEITTASLSALEEETKKLRRGEETAPAVFAGVEYVEFLRFYLKTFRDGGSARWRENCAVIQRLVCVFVVAKSGDMEVLKLVADMLMAYPECLPIGADAEELASVIIGQIADLPPPKGVQDAPVFLRNVELVVEIAKLLAFQWNQPGMQPLKVKCSRKIFNLLLTEEASEKPPSCLVSLLLDHFVSDRRVAHVGADVFNELLKGDRRKAFKQLGVALNVLLEWLVNLQKSETLASWVDRVMTVLRADPEGMEILTRAVYAWIPKIVRVLKMPMFRKHSLPVLTAMLKYSFTLPDESSCPFNLFVVEFAAVLNSLKNNDKTKDELLRFAAGLTEAYAQKFPHRAEVYGPFAECLAANGHEASAQNQLALKATEYGPGPLIQEVPAAIVPKSETGKTGLVNLGNTCYLNSVTQALFMTDAFRDVVLAAEPRRTETALAKLRVVFAFLFGTERSDYAPHDFLGDCIPPWFENGLQQDCSEFLQYLFDTLHRQEVEKEEGDAAEAAGAGGGMAVAVQQPVNSQKLVLFTGDERIEPVENWVAADGDATQVCPETFEVSDDESCDLSNGRGTSLTRWKTEENLNGQLAALGGKEDAVGLAGAAAASSSSVAAATGGDIAGCASGSHDSGIHSVGDEEPAESPVSWTGVGGVAVDDVLTDGGGAGGFAGDASLAENLEDDSAFTGSKTSLDNMDRCIKRKKTCNGDADGVDFDANGSTAVSEFQSAAASPQAVVEAPKRKSLVDQIFGGVMERVTRCLTCGAESKMVEEFRDLGVPCDLELPAAVSAPPPQPDPEPPAAPPSSPTQSSSAPPSPSRFPKISVAGGDFFNASSDVAGPQDMDVDMDADVDVDASSSSSPVPRRRAWTPSPPPVTSRVAIPLPPPAPAPAPPPPSPSSSSSARLNLADLLASYLQPEKLDGENKYFCENCRALRDAERTARITTAPVHLIVVLKRFSYNKVLQRKSKICRDVLCPERISLPVAAPSATAEFPYALYAAVIHSGMNSDSGHYFCYARHQTAARAGSEWYLLNDSKVEYTDYCSFQELTRRYQRDTAYVLFYRRLDERSVETPRFFGLPADLRQLVERDNEKFRAEKGEAEKRRLADAARRNWRRDKDDDDDHDGFPPGRSVGSKGIYREGAFQNCRDGVLHGASPHVNW